MISGACASFKNTKVITMKVIFKNLFKKARESASKYKRYDIHQICITKTSSIEPGFYLYSTSFYFLPRP